MKYVTRGEGGRRRLEAPQGYIATLLTSQVSSCLLLSHSIIQPGLCDTGQDRFGMEQKGQGWAGLGRCTSGC